MYLSYITFSKFTRQQLSTFPLFLSKHISLALSENFWYLFNFIYPYFQPSTHMYVYIIRPYSWDQDRIAILQRDTRRLADCLWTREFFHFVIKRRTVLLLHGLCGGWKLTRTDDIGLKSTTLPYYLELLGFLVHFVHRSVSQTEQNRTFLKINRFTSSGEWWIVIYMQSNKIHRVF